MPPAVKQAMQRDMIPHRSATFREFYLDLLPRLRSIHETDGDVVVLPGTGSAGWEIAIVNTLSPGDKVLAFASGYFGERFAAVGRVLGLNVIEIEGDWREAVTEVKVARALEAHPDVKAVLMTFSETSTGVLHPIDRVAPLVRDHGALLLVDAVSAAAVVPMKMDEYGVDIMLSGTQKAWMCPPGLVVVGVGPRVWEAYERSQYPRFFWDLKTAVEKSKTGDTPSTSSLTLLYALSAAVDMICAEGLDAVYARHQRLAERVRQGLTSLGFEVFADVDYASPSVTAAIPPAGTSVPELIGGLKTRFGIDLANGLGQLSDRVIRFGHMGWVHQPEIDRTLEAIQAVMQGE